MANTDSDDKLPSQGRDGHIVVLRLRAFELTSMMSSVGQWLDARSVTPASFDYDTRDDDELTVRIRFTTEGEAGAFAAAFCRKAPT
jgi:hypothetical protein